MVAIIGGSFARFRPLVDLYREAGRSVGYSPETLRVGVHAFGFVADTDQAARALFFPGWAYTFGKVGVERGWPSPTQAQFDAACSPAGAYLVGAPDTIVSRIRAMDQALGGVARLTFQMTPAMLDPVAMRCSIELLGAEVMARLRQAKKPV